MANGIGVQGAQAYRSPWLASAYRTPSGAWAGGVPPGYTPLTSGWVPEAAGMASPAPGAPGGVGGSGGQTLVLAPNMDFPVGAVSAVDPLRRMFSPPAGMIDLPLPVTDLGPDPVMFESLAGEPGVNLLPPWAGPALAGLDIANIATSDRPDAAKGMLAAQAILPAFGIPSPFLPVQAIDFVSRLFGGGGLFAGNRPHRPVSEAQAAASAEARRQGMLTHYGSVLGMTNPEVERHASANTALSIPEMVTVIQGMPVQDTSNPATIDARLQGTTPGFLSPYEEDQLRYAGSRIPREAVWVPEGEFGGSWAPPAASAPPTWEELSGWTPDQTSFQVGGMVPWVPGRPRSGDVVKSWLEPGEVVVPRELAPAVLQQFPHLAMTPRRQFFQGGGMVPWRGGGMESPVWAPGGGLRFGDGGRVPEEVYPEDGTLDLAAADRMFRRNPGLAKTHEYVPEAGKIVRKDYLPAFREQLEADRAYERQSQRVREQHRSGGGLRFEQGGRVPDSGRSGSAPKDEADFREWYASVVARTGVSPDPDDPLHFYDWRAAFRAGATPQYDPSDGRLHWPSRFKRQGHPRQFREGVDTITGERVGFQRGGIVPGRVATLATDVLREYGIRPVGTLTMNARRN